MPLIALFSHCAMAQKTIIYCGKLIDVKSMQALNEISLIIDGNKINDIQKGYI
ncbi:MAG TPA: hypothetical protein VMT76_10820 [Puia sp.]|nr:hypothetical protein [Puia sp.]